MSGDVIVTVTLNAALHVDYTTGELGAEGVNPVSRPSYRAGGRGVTVARVLRAFGHDVLAAGLAGGASGELIIQGLAKSGGPPAFPLIPAAPRRFFRFAGPAGPGSRFGGAGPRGRGWAGPGGYPGRRLDGARRGHGCRRGGSGAPARPRRAGGGPGTGPVAGLVVAGPAEARPGPGHGRRRSLDAGARRPGRPGSRGPGRLRAAARRGAGRARGALTADRHAPTR